MEVRPPEETREDIDRQQDLLFRPGHFEGLHALLRLFTDDVGADGDELRRAAVNALGGTFSAYYQADRDALVFLDAPLARLNDIEALVAHELVHAWHDQRADLGVFLDRNKTSLDRVTAGRCLMEGLAEAASSSVFLARQGRTLRDLDPGILDYTLGRLLGGEGSAVAYQEGMRFLHARFAEGGWEAVRAALDAVPPSSEQLLHPAKLGRDEPTDVALPDWPDDLGTAELRYEDTAGEAMIQSFLSLVGRPRREAGLATMGWDGDRWRVWRTPDGAEALVWRTVWDREMDALDFAAAFLGRPAPRRRAGRVVDFAWAPDPTVARRLLDALAALAEPAPGSPDDATSTAAVEAAWESEAARESAVEDGRWRIPRYGVSLPVPPGWSVREIRGSHFLVREAVGGFASNVNVTGSVNLEARGTEELVERALADLRRVGSEVVSGPSHGEVGGAPALRIDVEGTMGGTRLLRFAMLTFPRPNLSVTVTVTVPAEEWTESAAVVEEILAGVALETDP